MLSGPTLANVVYWIAGRRRWGHQCLRSRVEGGRVGEASFAERRWKFYGDTFGAADSSGRVVVAALPRVAHLPPVRAALWGEAVL